MATGTSGLSDRCFKHLFLPELSVFALESFIYHLYLYIHLSDNCQSDGMPNGI